MDTVVYFFILHDLNIVAKKEGYAHYLYDKDKGWVPDSNHLLSDRLIGYDESEDEGSPYRIGNTDMLNKVDEITEEEAMKLINNM